MQINRLFQIIYLLLNKKTITAKELATYFEVSLRTIYRDIELLSTAGIPIYTKQGKGGGISLVDTYVLNKSLLSEQEQNEILFALQSLAITQSSETDNVLSKVSTLFNKRHTNWIEVDVSSWGSSIDSKNDFTMIKHAILDGRVLQLTYFNNSGEKSIRKIEPLKLVFKVNAWYLQAFCRIKNDNRTFKLSRMSDISVTEETFLPTVPSSLNTKTSVDQKWMPAQLRISPEGRYRVFDEFKEHEITQNPDQSFTIHTYLPESDWAIQHLLSFGHTLEVISPKKLRKQMQTKLTQMIKIYKNSTIT
jgi:predicted DNA-binding transcriptional regulator YafY